jgi:DNA polymerase elongation subunit (family B)
MIISTEFNSDDSTLMISYYDETGNIAFIKKPIQSADLFNWMLTPNPTEFRNWDNRYLKKAQNKWLNRFRLEELTQTRLTPDELAKVYSDLSPKKYYLDIEIQLTSQDFPDPAKALMPVNLITFVNEDNVCFVLSTMKDLSNKTVSTMQDEVNDYFKAHSQIFSIKYVYFEKEEDMLNMFFHKALPKIPFLTGWNVIGFDWLYLINRCKRLGIDPMEKMPCAKLIGKNKMPIHLGLLDYMEVFMNTKPYKVVENYKLDYIANLVLGTTKLHSAYATMMEAQQDIENFVKYNIIDTILVKLIEDKLGLLDVAFAISKFAKVDVSKVFSAVFITETLMCREFLARGRYMANDKRDVENEATYDGAYVAKPEPGFYKYVSCFDFASMYPNIQIQFNISPDSYVGKSNSDTVINPETILTKNCTIFTNKFDSAARTILTKLYNGRVDTKNEMKKLEEQLDSEKSTKKT